MSASPLLVISAVCAVALGVRADAPTEPYDPTDPSEVAKQSGAAGGDAPLAGPDVDPNGGGGQGRRGPMMSPGDAMLPQSAEWILQQRCGSCHGTQKQKAGVQLAPIEMAFAGAQQDWTIVPGDPEASELITRIKLPAGHDDIMPPEGQPLSDVEIAVIEQWVKASTDKKTAIQGAKAGGGMQTDQRANRVDGRTWLAAYLAVDLTNEQRAEAIRVAQSLRKMQEDIQQARRKQQQARGSDQPALSPAEMIKQREQFQLLRQKVDAARESLWLALSTEQQEAFRALLADPEALQKAKQQGRRMQRQGRGRNQTRPPRD